MTETRALDLRSSGATAGPITRGRVLVTQRDLRPTNVSSVDAFFQTGAFYQ
jgi:hypothetical protein